MAERNLKNVKTLIPEARLQHRIREIAEQINKDYHNKEITAVCTLKGSFIFFADLIRHLEVPMTCEFLGLSSYGNATVSSGEVKVTLDINDTLENKHVLIFEDIVDTGLTLNFINHTLAARRPASLKTCALLVKPDCLKTEVEINYHGFEIEDHFVVGYGIDYAQKHRGLPYIGYVEHEH